LKQAVTAFNGYPFSIFLAVLLHGSVLAALLYLQQVSTQEIEVVRPPSVRAQLVGENPQVRNALEEQQRQARRVEEQRAAQQREEQQRQAAREQEQREQQQQQQREAEQRADVEQTALRERQEIERRQAEQRQAEERRRQEDADQQRQQEIALQQERQRQEQQREQALQAQRDAEAQVQAAVEAQAVMSYTTAIHDAVQSQWSRPPSARNGMVAVLRIRLVPTGDIIDVEIVQSSGDFNFDRAAESAVLKVDRFTEVQGMDIRLFDRNFRTFLLTFRPEDLLN